MIRENKIKMFANELAYIKNENLRKFAEELIANADDYFFVVPASSSGKYHPQFALGDGGLVRHTRCVAYFAKAMAESFNFNQEDSDLLVIAALAHDIKKQGNNTGHTVREHPMLASDYVCHIMEKFGEDVITNEQIQKICCAVASHMGKWENLPEWTRGKEPFPMPSNDFEKALQAADYVASRKAIEVFTFDSTDEVELPKLQEQRKDVDVDSYTLADLEVYVVPFGKHRGKTFKEVKPTGYLDWMVKQVDFNCKDVQDLAKRYLAILNGEINETLAVENNMNEVVATAADEDLPF